MSMLLLLLAGTALVFTAVNAIFVFASVKLVLADLTDIELLPPNITDYDEDFAYYNDSLKEMPNITYDHAVIREERVTLNT